MEQTQNKLLFSNLVKYESNKKIKAIKDEDDQRLLEFLDLIERTLMNGK